MGGAGKLWQVILLFVRFALQRGEWQRSEFESLKVGGEPPLTGDVNEKTLRFKMNSLMATPRGSNIEPWKARADSSSDVRGKDVVLGTSKEMRFLLEIDRIVGPSLSLRENGGQKCSNDAIKGWDR
jgi:hypothetical protein